MLVVKCEINKNHNKIVRNYNYIKIRCQSPDPNINYRELNLVFDLWTWVLLRFLSSAFCGRTASLHNLTMHSSFFRFFVIVSLSVRLQFLLYEFSLYAHLAVCEFNLYLICLGSVFDKRYKKNHTNLHGQLVESVLFCCWFWFVNFSFMLRERKWKEINSENKLTKSESKQGLKTVFEEENLDENHKRNLTWLCVIFSTLVWLTILSTLSILYHFVTVCACPKRIMFSFHLCFSSRLYIFICK